MGLYRANGFAVVTVPNEVEDDHECSKPLFQVLALVCGSDRPERLFGPGAFLGRRTKSYSPSL